MSKEETKDYVKSLMGGHDEAALKAAWDEVKNPKDWREPINAVVVNKSDEELQLIKFAVEFYTATECELLEVFSLEGRDSRRTRVKAIGYRMGSAGDH